MSSEQIGIELVATTSDASEVGRSRFVQTIAFVLVMAAVGFGSALAWWAVGGQTWLDAGAVVRGKFVGGAAVAEEIFSNAMASLVSLYNALPLEKWLILIFGLWACVFIVTTALKFRWPMFRRHGMAYWVFQLMLAVCGLLVVIQLSSIVLSIFADINTFGATTTLSALVLGLAVAYVISEYKESEKFNRKKFIGHFACPVAMATLPFGYRLGKYAIIHCGGLC